MQVIEGITLKDPKQQARVTIAHNWQAPHPCFGGCGQMVSANKKQCLSCLMLETTDAKLQEYAKRVMPDAYGHYHLPSDHPAIITGE